MPSTFTDRNSLEKQAAGENNNSSFIAHASKDSGVG